MWLWYLSHCTKHRPTRLLGLYAEDTTTLIPWGLHISDVVDQIYFRPSIWWATGDIAELISSSTDTAATRALLITPHPPDFYQPTEKHTKAVLPKL